MIGDLARLRAEHEAAEAAKAAKLARDRKRTGRAFKLLFVVLALLFAYLIFQCGYASGYLDGLARK